MGGFRGFRIPKISATAGIALLLNKYPSKFLDNQFNRIFNRYGIKSSLTNENYTTIREIINEK